MSRQPRKVSPEADISAFIEALRPIRVGRDNYTRLDRYRDFHAVFSDERGKRVLSQIIDYAEGGVVTAAELESHAQLAAKAGARKVAQWVSAMATVPPRETEGDK